MPNGRVIGLSKIPRIIDTYARRLQIQERLTEEVAQALEKIVRPHGVAVVLEATHFCMGTRGVQKPSASTTTTCLLGDMQSNFDLKQEFLAHISRK